MFRVSVKRVCVEKGDSWSFVGKILILGREIELEDVGFVWGRGHVGVEKPSRVLWGVVFACLDEVCFA